MRHGLAHTDDTRNVWVVSDALSQSSNHRIVAWRVGIQQLLNDHLTYICARLETTSASLENTVHESR